ncbi:MAG: hypothetical protein GY835_04310 [bacterium]|nr:hypothetical protein [bacterium]
MNWQVHLKQMEEYYRWKRDHHPAYPDLMLEWGLFHHLYGNMVDDADSRTSTIQEGSATLKRLQADGCQFFDLTCWADWAATHYPESGVSPTAPTPEEIENQFRSGGDLAQATIVDELLSRIGDLGDAPSAVRRSALCPAFRRLYASMAESSAHRGDEEIAEVFFAWAVLVGGNTAKYWVYEIQLNKIMGRQDNLMEILNQGLGNYPDDIELVREMALEMDRQGETGRAIEFMSRAVELRPAWPDLRYDLARMYQESESPEESLIHFDKALEINPAYAKAAVSQAEALLHVGDVETAERRLLDLKEKDVEPREVYRLLSQVYAERQDHRRAERFGVLGQDTDK